MDHGPKYQGYKTPREIHKSVFASSCPEEKQIFLKWRLWFGYSFSVPQGPNVVKGLVPRMALLEGDRPLKGVGLLEGL
jgi:hypothetical protein